MADTIAKSYLTPGSRKAMEQAVREAKMRNASTYISSKLLKNTSEPQRVYRPDMDQIQDQLVYNLYPDKIKRLTEANTSASNAIDSAIEWAASYNRATAYTSRNVIENITKMQAFRQNAVPMLMAAWDTETLELVDSDGKIHRHIMEYGFSYHTAGGKQFTHLGLIDPGLKSGEMISSGLIGIDDPEMVDLLTNLRNKVKNGKVPLTEKENVVYNFLSRLGDEGTKINYWENGEGANVIGLTEKAEAEYKNLINLDKGINIVTKKLGDQKRQGINPGYKRMIDNMALLVSDEVDLVVGANTIGFDIGWGQGVGLGSQINRDYWNQVYKGNGTFAQRVFPKTYDLFEIAKSGSPEARATFHRELFTGDMARKMTGGYDKQENIVVATGEKLVTSHAAGGDAYGEARIAIQLDSAYTHLEDAILAEEAQHPIVQRYGQGGFLLKGTLLQANESGSVDSLSGFSNYIVGTVSSPAGNTYYSTGAVFNKTQQKHYTQNRMIPALYNKDVTYSVEAMDRIAADTIQDPVIRDNLQFAGQDIYHYRLSQYGDPRLNYLERMARKTDIYIPASRNEEFLRRFNVVAVPQQDGTLKVTERGLNHLKDYREGTLAEGFSRPLTGATEDEALAFYAKLNNARTRDSAERSLIKWKNNTMSQAIQFHHYLNEGNFAEGLDQAGKVNALYTAILEGNTKVDQGYSKLKAIVGNTPKAQDEAVKFAQNFIIKEEMNPGFLTNVTIIGATMKKGSLLETLDTLVREEGADLINKEYGGKAYTGMMDTAVKYMQSKMTRRGRGYQKKFVDQSDMFYINMDQLVRQRKQVGPYIDDTAHSYLGIHLTGPYAAASTLGSMKSVYGMAPGERASAGRTRTVMFEMLRAVGNSPVAQHTYVGINGTPTSLNKEINRMFADKDNPINRRNPDDIISELIDHVKRLRASDGGDMLGLKDTNIEVTLDSALLQGHSLTDAQTEEIRNVIRGAKNTIAGTGTNSLNRKINVQAEELHKTLTREADTGLQEKLLTNQGYNKQRALLLDGIADLNKEGMRAYSKSLVNIIEVAGGRMDITQGGQVFVSFTPGKWEDWTNDVLHMRTNSAGASIIRPGIAGASYVGRPVVVWDKKAPGLNKIKAISSIDMAVIKYMNPGTKTYQDMMDAIQTGENKSIAVRRVLKKVGTEIRTAPLSRGSISSDMMDMGTIDLTTLLYKGDLTDERLDALEAMAAGNEEKTKSVQVLRQMAKQLAEGKKLDDVLQIEQITAVERILTGHDALVNFSEGSVVQNLTTNFHQKASGITAGLYEEAPYALSQFSKAGKFMPHFAANSAYFKVSDTPELANSVIQAPMFSTPESAVIDQFDAGYGIKLTNALQVRAVQTDAAVKERIQDLLLEHGRNIQVNEAEFRRGTEAVNRIMAGRSFEAERAARTFSKRLNTALGGGMASGLLLDAYDTSWGDKVIRVNEREFDFGTSKTNEAFRKATRMRYKNGAFQYGRGVYNDYDDVVASFQQKYSPHLQKEFAKGPSVTTLEFVTKDGRVPLSAAEVQRAVEEAAAKSNKTINNLNDFLGVARELFDESIVNRSIYESDHRKLFFDGVKHVSTSSTLFLNQLANNQEALREAAGDIREIASNPEARETLVRNILHHGAFGRVLKGSGLDEARALSTEFHTALANMDFEHPFFKRFASKKNPNALENEIYQGFVNTGMFGAGVTDAAKLTAEQKQTVKQYWGDFLTQFRHSLDTMLSDVTEGGMLFGNSVTDQIKQEDAQMLVSRTVQAIHEHIAQSGQHVGQSLNELEENLKVLNQLGVFTREGRAVTFTALNQTINVPNGIDRFDIPKLEQFWTNVLHRDLGETIGNLQNVTEDGKIKSGFVEMRNMIDDTTSLKGIRITDREISGFSSRIWTTDIAEAVEEGVSADWGADKKFMSKYLQVADIRTKAINQALMDQDILDMMFKHNAMASFGYNAYGHPKNKRIGDTVHAGIAYDKAAVLAEDPYRKVKTNALVTLAAARSGVSDPYVSQEFADNLYTVASEKSAARFNALSTKARDINNLLTDWGKNQTDVNYFQQMSLAEHTPFDKEGTLLSMANDANSELRKNTVWDMTDTSIGLTKDVLGPNRTMVAVAGTNSAEFKDLQDMYSRNKPQEALDSVWRAQEKVRSAYATNPSGEEYKRAVEDYKERIDTLMTTVARNASGKEETSLLHNMLGFQMPGAMSGKVNVTDTTTFEVLNKDSKELDYVLGDKTFQGKSLKEWIKKGRHVNYAIIGEGQLKEMGFTDEYFKSIGITKQEWLQKAKTEGVAAVTHRYPTAYWGSNMGVQLYVDSEHTRGLLYSDELTANFMKADADGDRAQLFMLGATKKDGRWYDINSLQMADSSSSEEVAALQKEMENLSASHGKMMQAQIYYYNPMIKQETEFINEIRPWFDKYKDKSSHLDLSGAKMASRTMALSPETYNNYSYEFYRHKDTLAEALEKSRSSLTGDTAKYNAAIQSLKESQTGQEAYQIVSGMIDDNKGLRQALWENLGTNQDAVNKAYQHAMALEEADTMFLQRIMKGGAGAIDNPFTAADMLRREALAINVGGRPAMSATDSFAIQMLREQVQEEFLTPKHATMQDVDALNDLKSVNNFFSKVFSGKASDADKGELVQLLSKRARDPGKRYRAFGMLAQYADEEGTIGIERIAAAAVDAVERGSNILREAARNGGDDGRIASNILNTTQRMVSWANSRIDGISNVSRSMGNLVVGSTSAYEGNAVQTASTVSLGATVNKAAAKQFQEASGFIEKTVAKAGKGGWSKNAIALASAVMLTGFIGGNPSTPTQRQAEQEYYQQEPQPAPITLADPSMSVSQRKQPGYVININAQTQKDKEYASRVISQAVTRNFQNTNVNVSMNVNQQPGNISGKEIADYLASAF